MMDITEYLPLLFGAVATPLGLWVQRLLLRRRYDTELDQLRASVEASRTGTRGDELENVKRAMSILMEQVVEPLKREIHAVRKELMRLRRAIREATRCPLAAADGDCPVLRELRRPEEPASPPAAGAPGGA